MRIVVRDSDHAISFLTDAAAVPALVAACASEPKSVEALLLAAESFYPGISDEIMNELMRFDLWMEGGATKVRLLRPEPGAEPKLPRAFEIVDPVTRQMGYVADAEGLVVLDLDTREISASDPSIRLPGNFGSVLRRDPTGEFEIETVYALGPAWNVVNEPVYAGAGGAHG